MGDGRGAEGGCNTTEGEQDAGVLGPLDEGAGPARTAAPYTAWHRDADPSEKAAKQTRVCICPSACEGLSR